MPTKKRKNTRSNTRSNKRRGRTRRKNLRGGDRLSRFLPWGRKSNVKDDNVIDTPTFDMDEKSKNLNDEALEALGQRDDSIWSDKIEGEGVEWEEDNFMGAPVPTEPSTSPMDLGKEVIDERIEEDMAKKAEEKEERDAKFNESRNYTQKKVSPKALKFFGETNEVVRNAKGTRRIGVEDEYIRVAEEKAKADALAKADKDFEKNTTWLGGKRTRRRRRIKNKRR